MVVDVVLDVVADVVVGVAANVVVGVAAEVEVDVVLDVVVGVIVDRVGLIVEIVLVVEDAVAESFARVLGKQEQPLDTRDAGYCET